MKILFLDESGDHNLSVIDPQYPLFVLGGIIVDKDYAEGELDREARAFKRELFGREDLLLHTADITRNRAGFERMIEPEFRARFLQAKAIERRVLGLNLRDKAENIAGLQLADLVATPVGRFVLGKAIKEDFEIVKSKFRRNLKGQYEGYGLVVLPRK